MKTYEIEVDVNDFDKCIFCKGEVRVHLLENTKTKNARNVNSKLFFCYCKKCKERYIVETGLKQVRIYKVTNFINGKLK